jgi:hypothetical protein
MVGSLGGWDSRANCCGELCVAIDGCKTIVVLMHGNPQCPAPIPIPAAADLCGAGVAFGIYGICMRYSVDALPAAIARMGAAYVATLRVTALVCLFIGGALVRRGWE